MVDNLMQLYAYNRWADERVYQACRQLAETDYQREPTPGWSSVHSTLFHIAGATQLWARRFEGEVVTSFPDEREVAGWEAAWRMLDDGQKRIERIITTSSLEELNAIRTFKSLKGEPRTMPFWAGLRHVVNHATYHRGQIASKLKRLGVEPPITDLAAWAMEQVERSG